MLMARLIDDQNSKITIQGAEVARQYLIQKGLKVFGEEGRKALLKEMDQLHRRNCFTPRSIADMTVIERRRAQQASMFLTEKRNNPSKEEWFSTGSQQENG